MKPVPKAMIGPYDALLGAKKIPRSAFPYYRKWLRYYLDFCQKYHFDPSDTKSLHAFLKKLDQKKQSVQQQKQASDAILLYHELKAGKTRTPAKPKAPSSAETRRNIRKRDTPKLANADWTHVFEKLASEIKLRHYSTSTLKTYVGWARQFPGFHKEQRSPVTG